MDINDIVELSNSIYLMVVRELKNKNIPATVGRIVVESVYRRITEDAYALTAIHSKDLEAELKRKEKEIDDLKLKIGDAK